MLTSWDQPAGTTCAEPVPVYAQTDQKRTLEKVYSDACTIQSTSNSLGLMAANTQPVKSSIDW